MEATLRRWCPTILAPFQEAHIHLSGFCPGDDTDMQCCIAQVSSENQNSDEFEPDPADTTIINPDGNNLYAYGNVQG